jgi:hypothetical protein
MKVTSSNLDELKVALLEKNAALDTQTKAAKAATDLRDSLAGDMRLLQGAFDICASAFAQDTELSANQLNDLPAAAQGVLGYTKPAKPAPAA